MKTTRGFTLIELMIVVAIIAIMVAIGYPSYTNSLIKARRSDVQQLLLDVVNRQQQFMLDRRQWSNSFVDLGITKEDWTCTATQCTNDFYTVTLTNSTAPPPTFTVTATSKGVQISDGNLTINSAGAKTPGDKW